MADKRISQLVDRGTVANNDVVPIVVSGATTTNKATISSIQTFMQGNLDLGVTSVGITLGSSGTDVSVSGSPITSSGNITINLPTASATNRGLLSAADWTTFNSKQQAITLTTTGTSGAATLVSGTLNIPNYSTDLSGYVTLGTTQTITAQKTFTTSGSSDTMIISHGSGSGFALDVLKAGNGEAIRVTKTSGSGNAMTISGGNFEAGTIVKTGGTSSQFLKADGSVDSSTYLTTGSAASTYVPYTGATGNVDLGTQGLTAGALFVEAGPTYGGALNLRQASGHSLWSGAPYTSIYAQPGNRVVFNFSNDNRTVTLDGSLVSASTPRTFTFPDATGTLALSTDLGAYLPLTGGTLTGALNGTSASFSGTITSTVGNNSTLLNSASASTGWVQIAMNNTTGSTLLGVEGATAGTLATGTNAYASVLRNYTATDFQIATNNVVRATISSTGAATFSSSVTASNFVATSADTTGTNVNIINTSTGGYNWNIFSGGSSGTLAPVGSLIFRDSTIGASRMVISSSGNVGIGTDSPSRLLEVSVADRPQMRVQYKGISNLYLDISDERLARRIPSDTGGNNFTISVEGGQNSGGFGAFTIETGTIGNLTERMRVTQGGDVLVGMQSNGGASVTSVRAGLLSGQRTASGDECLSGWNQATSGDNKFVAFYTEANGTLRGTIDYNRAAGLVRYNVTSDKNLKNLIGDSDGKKSIEILNSTRIREYSWKDDETEKVQIGIIAQELYETYKGAVSVGSDEELLGTEDYKPWAVDKTAFAFHLIAGWQEHEKQIKELQSQIDSLKNQIK